MREAALFKRDRTKFMTVAQVLMTARIIGAAHSGNYQGWDLHDWNGGNGQGRVLETKIEKQRGCIYRLNKNR